MAIAEKLFSRDYNMQFNCFLSGKMNKCLYRINSALTGTPIFCDKRKWNIKQRLLNPYDFDDNEIRQVDNSEFETVRNKIKDELKNLFSDMQKSLLIHQRSFRSFHFKVL